MVSCSKSFTFMKMITLFFPVSVLYNFSLTGSTAQIKKTLDKAIAVNYSYKNNIRHVLQK